jgi:HD-like signal output (HDOD) protein
MVDIQNYSFPSALEMKLKSIDALISLPEIYLKYRRLMDDPESTVGNFAEVVGLDANLSAVVLKIVNSPVYGLSGKIDQISKAIHVLGTDKLHDVVLTASLMALNYPNEILPLVTFWRHSLFCGVFSRLLGEQLHFEESESFFIIGLLHQIGHLVMYSHYPEQSKQAILRAKQENQAMDTAEQSIMGFHYGHVGAKLMAQWRLPLLFQVLTYFQPTPLEAPLLQRQTALLHLAHGYADWYVNIQDNISESMINPNVCQILQITPKDIHSTLEQAKQLSCELEKVILK